MKGGGRCVGRRATVGQSRRFHASCATYTVSLSACSMGGITIPQAKYGTTFIGIAF